MIAPPTRIKPKNRMREKARPRVDRLVESLLARKVSQCESLRKFCEHAPAGQFEPFLEALAPILGTAQHAAVKAMLAGPEALREHLHRVNTAAPGLRVLSMRFHEAGAIPVVDDVDDTEDSGDGETMHQAAKKCPTCGGKCPSCGRFTEDEAILPDLLPDDFDDEHDTRPDVVSESRRRRESRPILTMTFGSDERENRRLNEQLAARVTKLR